MHVYIYLYIHINLDKDTDIEMFLSYNSPNRFMYFSPKPSSLLNLLCTIIVELQFDTFRAQTYQQESLP